jgi:GT2 family glycosyltransferase
MADYSVSISVVTYNSAAHIRNLMDSIAHNVFGVPYHIFVVDNGSSDGTQDIVRGLGCPSVTLIESDRNRGFGGGHNMVLNRISSKYHLCVNPDVIIDSDVITDMAHYLDAHEDIGMLSPKVLNTDGTLQLLPKKNPRLIFLIARRVNLPFLRKYRCEYEMADSDSEEKRDIEFCSGCFMFMRTSLFKEIEGFDERFFMYFEDADLTRRIREKARVQYNPVFSVYHCWERAGGKKLKYFLIQLVSMFRYMAKWREHNCREGKAAKA